MSKRHWSTVTGLAACFVLLFTGTMLSAQSQSNIAELTITDKEIIAGAEEPGEHPLITAHVSVLDERGQHVAGLGSGDFTVQEFTEPVSGVSVSQERQGVAVDLLVDVSGSMKGLGMSPDGRLQDVKKAMERFIEGLGEKDMVGVFTFSKVVEQIHPLAPAEEAKAIGRTVEVQTDPALQFTCLYDAMWAAVEDLTGGGEERGSEFARVKKAIFVFSDGADSGLEVCNYELSDVKKLLMARDPKSKISVYGVGVGTEDAPRFPPYFGDLKNLADITEGEFIHYFGQGAQEQLTTAFESFLTQGEQYVIQYGTDACADQLTLHIEAGGKSDEVEVKIPPVNPIIALTGLEEGQTVSGKVTLEPDFELKQCPIREVSYYVDGYKSATVAPPFEWNWDTSQTPRNPNVDSLQEDSEGNGLIENIVVKAEAYDQKGRYASDEVSGVRVKIPHPEVEIDTPTRGALIEREGRWRSKCEETTRAELPVEIELIRSSRPIEKVRYYLDGKSVGSLQAVPEREHVLDISTLGCSDIGAETRHTLEVQVVDDLGLSGEAEVPFKVKVHRENFWAMLGRVLTGQLPAWLALVLVIALGAYVLVVGPQQAVEEVRRGVVKLTEVLGVVIKGTRLVLVEDGKDVRPYAVTDVTRLGRDQTSVDIAFDNENVSRLHATLVKEDEDFVLYDEGSKNGTWVNERRLPFKGQTVLEDGDVIELGRGSVQLRFEREEQLKRDGENRS